MEKYLLLLFLSCCGAFTICGAQTVTVRGRVIDRKTGEVLSDANVADLVLGTGVATNSYGLYSIHVKSKQCILRCSMLGYATKIDTLTLAVNMVHDFALMPDNYQLNDVEIVGERKFGGQLALTQKEIQSFPTLGSEPDVLKSLQYLPGVISGNEGTNNISVRGSDQWGNLVLLDEAMVYNPNHALSFFSVFNNDAIQQVNLYKSYFPLMYGGRTSSVIDVRMREGNNQEKHRSATIGVIASKLQLEGPIKRDKTSGNLSAIFSNYYYRYKSMADGMKYLWKSNMQSYQLKYDVDYAFSNMLHIKSGLSGHTFTIMPGGIDNWGDLNNVVPYRMNRRRLLDIAAYGEISYEISPRWQFNGGIRLSTIYSPKVSTYKQKCYVMPEPRAELSYFPGKGDKLHVAFTQSSQSLHMLSNSSVGIPSDIWIPVNGRVKPAVMKQMAIGYKKNWAKGAYSFSMEAYYRKTNHIVDFVDNANIFLNNQIESQLGFGFSKAYGAEFYFSKNVGQLTGWISYTLSRAQNKVATFEDNEYPPVYDRPHSLKIFLNCEAGRRRRCAFAATFSYNSGMNLTLPIAHYKTQGTSFYIYSTRNGYRAPAFHQLDLSMACKLRKGRLIFSVINVYNRKNVFTMYTSRSEFSFRDLEIHKMYLYGTLPSVSYQFKF